MQSPVDQSSAVRLVKRPAQLAHPRGQLRWFVERTRTGAADAGEAGPLRKFIADGHASGILDQFEDLRKSFSSQRLHPFHFALQFRACKAVEREPFRQEFERDLALVRFIARQPDCGNRASTELAAEHKTP